MAFSEEWLTERLRANRALQIVDNLRARVTAPALPALRYAEDTLTAPGATRKREDGYASALEAQYAHDVLESLRARGVVLAWWYEGLTFELAPKTFYTPDFLVQYADGRPLELHEVKGFWRDDARVKIKVAATRYSAFRFMGLQKKRGAWITEYFPVR